MERGNRDSENMKLLCDDDHSGLLGTLQELEEDWDRVLCGPHFDEECEPDEDDIFAKSWRSGLADWVYDLSINTEGNTLREVEKYVASRAALDQAIVELDGGVFVAPLINEGDLCLGVAAVSIIDGEPILLGAFCGAHLGVNPDHGDKGVGKALVAGMLLYSGELPTWNLDQPAYSHRGAQTVYRGTMELQTLLEAKYSPRIKP